MANTATKGSLLRNFHETANNSYLIYPYYIVYDTAATDLLIETPSTKKQIQVVGLELVNDVDYDLTFKSGTSANLVYKLGANSGRVHGVKPSNIEVLFATEPGEALNIQSTTTLPNFILYAMEV